MSSLARSEKAELSDAPIQGSEDSVSCRLKRGAIIQEIPIEVMTIIFGVLDKQDCAVAAVVCRGWSGVALDELWRSLPSLRPLFELLGPMEETDLGYDLHPDTVLTAKSWDLFKSYGARVRHFAYEDQNYDLGISSGLIMQALAAHPVGGILPNLQSVDWDVDGLRLDNILAFCPPSLRRLRLQIYTGNVEPEQVQRLLSGLSSSLANRLESFEFGADYLPTENAALSTALNTFIKTQRGLLELRLPSYYLQDPATVSAVCQALPRLRTFSAEVLGFTREMFQVALNALATRSSSLRCIQLARSGNNSLEETMCLADIEPLLELSVVEDVRLWFDFKMDLEVQNIRQMGQAWRKLAALILYSDQGSQLHLSHLVTFAESFPALENFAAAFDCTGEIHNTGGGPSRFKRLRRLTLLGNPPQDRARQPLAEFLTMVCEPDVTVVFRPEGVDSSDVIACEFDWDRLGYHDPLTGEVRDWMAKLYQAQESTKQSH